MDEIEDATDPREQMFHNNVREQIVSDTQIDFFLALKLVPNKNIN